jgi:hypothetical protein
VPRFQELGRIATAAVNLGVCTAVGNTRYCVWKVEISFSRSMRVCGGGALNTVRNSSAVAISSIVSRYAHERSHDDHTLSDCLMRSAAKRLYPRFWDFRNDALLTLKPLLG